MKRSYFIGILSFLCLLVGCVEEEEIDYWTESTLCDSRDTCIELGDRSGEEYFDVLKRGFEFSNREMFWSVGLETDEYLEEQGFSFMDYIIAEYEIEDGNPERISGDDHPFSQQMNKLVTNLLFHEFVDVNSIVYLSEGYPYLRLFDEGIQIGIPMYLEQYHSQHTVYFLTHEIAHAVTMKDRNDTELCNESYSVDTCFDSGSYMRKFSEEFWTEHPKQWMEFDYRSMNYEERKEFYNENMNQFVSIYASISPQEDIAESFTHFLLSPYNKNPETIAEEKVQFFYEFDEFVEYRAHVLSYFREVYKETGSFY